MSKSRIELWHSTGLLVLRLGIGGYMMTHGWGKAKMLAAGQFEMLGDGVLGLGPHVTLVLLVMAELVCAGLVVIGLGTRIAAIPIVITMGFAGLIVHGSDPWTMDRAAQLFMSGESESWASKEPALLFMFAFLALILTGPGRFSIDDAVCRFRTSRSQHAAS